MNSKFQPIKKNPLLLRSLVLDEELYEHFEEIACNCKRLLHLEVGHVKCKHHLDGSIWNGQESINCDEFLESEASIISDDELDDSESEEGQFELDVRLISQNLHELKSLHINSCLQLKRQSVAPPTLDDLTDLEDLRMCPLKPGIRCDRSRDEWNLRTLAQNSSVLRVLDLRGCYLRILSLGWLKTQQLEALHLYYQVPAVSVLFKWSKTIKYLTLAKISHRYKAYRSMGPDKPDEELDACLICLGSVDDSQLTQLDIQGSDCSLGPLKTLILCCGELSYLDTRNCSKLEEKFKVRLTDRQSILTTFS